MKFSGSSRGDEPEAAVNRTFRKHLRSVVAYEFSVLIRVQADETYGLIGDADIILTFVRRAWIYEYEVLKLGEFDWKEKQLIVRNERFSKRYGHFIFGKCLILKTKTARFGFIKLKGDKRGVAVL